MAAAGAGVFRFGAALGAAFFVAMIQSFRREPRALVLTPRPVDPVVVSPLSVDR